MRTTSRPVFLGGREPLDCDGARYVIAAALAFWLCVLVVVAG